MNVSQVPSSLVPLRPAPAQGLAASPPAPDEPADRFWNRAARPALDGAVIMGIPAAAVAAFGSTGPGALAGLALGSAWAGYAAARAVPLQMFPLKILAFPAGMIGGALLGAGAAALGSGLGWPGVALSAALGGTVAGAIAYFDRSDL